MIGRRLTLGAVLIAAIGGALGCSQVQTSDGAPSAQADQAILDGTAATDAKYNAIGALMYETAGGLNQACSGTLVAKKAVVTARHCMKYIDQAKAAGKPIYFGFGADMLAPDQLIPIKSYVAAPPSKNGQGLLQDGGRDVAVVYLKSAPAHIQPAKLGEFDADMLGKKFQIAGFGISDFFGDYGQRFVGSGTARALKGYWYPLLFNSDKQAFLDWYWTDSADAEPSDAQAETWWTTYMLETGYELLAAGLPGESTACYGDSGGPLFLEKKSGDLKVYGVSFAVEATYSSICGLGNGFLIFNDKMLDFVQTAIGKD